jgi:hypothetical protein
MDTLTETVRAAMMGYARKGLNSHSYLTHSDDNMILSVVTVPKGKSGSFVSLLVRVFGGTVIIERDQNDKPLVDALVQAGVPRSRIILAYAGEPVPESA